ncbi:MAG: cofactor-independent phosphoglycerate mutase, partial [Candidatus Omnitrophica bacterium]|nr:cofactor-independent phosphoglycerate mutase [Candidatus Omnitrophota bacterium]
KDKEDFRILVLPDHATPIALKTHVADPVLFGIYGTGIIGKGFVKYSEKEAGNSDLVFENGPALMEYFIKRN